MICTGTMMVQRACSPTMTDSHRFERPIYSLRLFSDSRLSFDTQLYGWDVLHPYLLQRPFNVLQCRWALSQTLSNEATKLAAPRFSNGAFTVDMPRGCITVLEAGGYRCGGRQALRAAHGPCRSLALADAIIVHCHKPQHLVLGVLWKTPSPQ